MPKKHHVLDRPVHIRLVAHVGRSGLGFRLEVDLLYECPAFHETLGSRASREDLVRLRAEIDRVLDA